MVLNSLPCVLVSLCLVFFSSSPCKARIYTNHWAVRIAGGPEQADHIAGKYGYRNLGQVRESCTNMFWSVSRVLFYRICCPVLFPLSSSVLSLWLKFKRQGWKLYTQVSLINSRFQDFNLSFNRFINLPEDSFLAQEYPVLRVKPSEQTGLCWLPTTTGVFETLLRVSGYICCFLLVMNVNKSFLCVAYFCIIK